MEVTFTANLVFVYNKAGERIGLTHDEARQLCRKLDAWLNARNVPTPEDERAANDFEGWPV